jgi:hypothetical protein
MSVQTTPARDTRAAGTHTKYNDRAIGWLIFSGTMLVIIGIMNVVVGIAAIGDSNFFVTGADFVFADLNTWGWIVMLIGFGQLAAAAGVFANSRGAAWAGAGFAGLNALAQLMFLPAYPLLGLALFATDVIIIHGLVTYGGRETA